MKQVKIEFKICTPSDIWKWIWDKFCFPRRKLVEYWIVEYHDEMLKEYIMDEIFDRFVHESSDKEVERLSAFEQAINKIFRDQERDTIKIIMKKGK